MISDSSCSKSKSTCRFQMAAVKPLYVNLWERKWKTVLTEYLQVYFYGLGTQLCNKTSNWTMEPLFRTNGCATRFARRSSKHSKNHCQIPDITVSAHGFLREATTTENGWKSPMTPSHFQASRRIFGAWWAMATSSLTSPQTMPKPVLESMPVLLPAERANWQLLLQLRRLTGRALRQRQSPPSLPSTPQRQSAALAKLWPCPAPDHSKIFCSYDD